MPVLNILCALLVLSSGAAAGVINFHDNDALTGDTQTDTACGVVHTILGIGTGRGTCSSTNCISISNNQGPYDGSDDTLVGVVSSKGPPLNAVTAPSSTDGKDGNAMGCTKQRSPLDSVTLPLH